MLRLWCEQGIRLKYKKETICLRRRFRQGHRGKELFLKKQTTKHNTLRANRL